MVRSRILQEMWVADFACLLNGNRLFQANVEGALLRNYHNLAFPRQPTDSPIKDRRLALRQVLELRERDLAVGVERVRDSACHLPMSWSIVTPILIMLSQ